MMYTISASNGLYSYEVKSLSIETKKTNTEIAKDNLMDFSACLKDANSNFGLVYGTLLGAIRENNINAHYEDMDVIVFGRTIAEKKWGQVHR